MKNFRLGSMLSGAAAGAVNGLFGAGGGMVLVPMLSATVHPDEDSLFPISVSVILPVCIVSLVMTGISNGYLPWAESWPYLIGSALGGLICGLFGRKIPALWLHRGLGILILWGGIRYLC